MFFRPDSPLHDVNYGSHQEVVKKMSKPGPGLDIFLTTTCPYYLQTRMEKLLPSLIPPVLDVVPSVVFDVEDGSTILIILGNPRPMQHQRFLFKPRKVYSLSSPGIKSVGRRI